MSTVSLIITAILVFFVVALLYFQSRTEGFTINSILNKNPIAGRPYNPNIVPGPMTDFTTTPSTTRTIFQGRIPVSQQIQSQIPGGGTQTMPRESLAQIKDLRELDNKITTWLEAIGIKENEQPGSLIDAQRQERVQLLSRLRDVRDQIGTGVIVDTWKRVADETLALRRENQGWQQMSPSLEEVFTFGTGHDPNAFLTPDQYREFYDIFNAVILEMQGLAQPNPLQKIRLQQLQMMRQELMDHIAISKSHLNPPIQMGVARKYLSTILKPDQPLPSLVSMDPPSFSSSFLLFPLQTNPNTNPNPNTNININTNTNTNPHTNDILSDLNDIELSHFNPSLKRVTTTIRNQIRSNQITPQDARNQVLALKSLNAPSPFTNKANILCKQIYEAFPNDATALGCKPKITDDIDAESVIQTVCNRLRYSVPSVTPEQFNCPRTL